tara:strand:- start:283 stop:1542 length:1260 start_codon:yes stop_codon:yes gene_type:complete
MFQDLEKNVSKVKQSSLDLSLVTPNQRKNCLSLLSEKLDSNKAKIIEINKEEITQALKSGLDNHVLDRMRLSEDSIDRMIDSLVTVRDMPDTVSEIIETNKRSNGLIVNKVRVPLGVLGVIFESRPNVVIEIASLAIKSGNGLVMRGGKDCIKTNLYLFKLVKQSLSESGIPDDSMYFLDFIDRKAVDVILSMDEYIDLLIPRGSSELVNLVNQNAKMPSITGGVGVCHTYVDRDVDIEQAISIIDNAKTQNPSVCNALDTVIIHKEILNSLLEPLVKNLSDRNVEIKVDEYAYKIIGSNKSVSLAKKGDFGQEFLDLVVSIKTVENLDMAISHITKYGSKHSEAIITKNKDSAKYFIDKVDASAVFHNTSTRFNDGFELGLGAEVAVSTDKLHARGPMGINDLMTYKWVVLGEGQIRT